MGTVPLLTREGESNIAKRIDAGQLVVMKAITPLAHRIKELHRRGMNLRKGARVPSRKCVTPDTNKKDANRNTTQALKHIEKIAKLYELALNRRSSSTTRRIEKAAVRAREVARGPHARGNFPGNSRHRLQPFEKKRLWTRCAAPVERLQSLEREAGRLERRADVSKGENAAEARRELSLAAFGTEGHRGRQEVG